MGIIFEIGANWGTDTVKFLADPNNTVYAFEPIPHLIRHLDKELGKNQNLHLINAAIDIENGWRNFNISDVSDWGVSSFYEFSDDIQTIWPGRDDFRWTDHRTNVMCMRLDTFMEWYSIPHIDYLWIDAQGNDFRVLKSLGDKIKTVKEGRCEVALSTELYKGTENTVSIVQPWLEEQGFTVTVQPDLCGGREADLVFKRL